MLSGLPSGWIFSWKMKNELLYKEEEVVISR